MGTTLAGATRVASSLKSPLRAPEPHLLWVRGRGGWIRGTGASLHVTSACDLPSRDLAPAGKDAKRPWMQVLDAEARIFMFQ